MQDDTPTWQEKLVKSSELTWEFFDELRLECRVLGIPGEIIESVVEGLRGFHKSRAIDLKNLFLDVIPSRILRLPNIKMLDLSLNNFRYLPKIERFIEVENLIIKDNPLEEFSEGLGKLYKLRLLNISKTKITELPLDFHQLHNLTNFISFGTPLIRLPYKIEEMQNLKSLYVANAKLSEIPEFLGNLELDYLTLMGNNLQTIPPGIGLMHSLKLLNLAGNSLSKIPDLIDLPNLQRLILSSNNISDFGELRVLPKLEELYLNGNRLKQLPPLELFPNLRVLVINDNLLREFPDISILTNLEVLKIQGNNITHFEIYNDILRQRVAQLRILELDSVFETQLPAEIRRICKFFR